MKRWHGVRYRIYFQLNTKRAGIKITAAAYIFIALSLCDDVVKCTWTIICNEIGANSLSGSAPPTRYVDEFPYSDQNHEAVLLFSSESSLAIPITRPKMETGNNESNYGAVRAASGPFRFSRPFGARAKHSVASTHEVNTS